MDALNPSGSADTTLATYTQGLLTQLRDPRGVLRSYRYDLRGLMTAEIDEAGAVDSAKYDHAGLVTVHRTRYIASVTNIYDALDRLTKTVIPGRTLSYLGQNANVPADSVLRSYDVMGNVVSESNRNATITRTYFATGHLRSERVVPVSNRALADSTWYVYDNGGRLRRVSWQSGDSVVYKYNSAGDLDTMRVHIWRSGGNLLERWRFEWDGLGRRRTIHYPFLSMRVDYAYDRLGTLRRIESSNPGSSYSTNRFDFTFRQDSVDVLGRPLHQTMQCPYGFGAGDPGIPCRDWLPSATTNRYNRLGALVVQTLLGTGPVRDTLRYDRSGNLIQRRDGLVGYVTEYLYPSASNRLSTQRDSTVGVPGHSDRNFNYDAAGNRLRSAKQSNDTIYWQYDAVARLVGTVKKLPPPPVGGTTLPNLNGCRWHPSGKLGQPCGTGGQLGFVGENVTRSSLGWFFVHAPGIDEAVLLIHRSDAGVVHQRLQAVTDGRGQLLAIADSSGFITAEYAGSGYDQAAWLGAGLTSRAQTYESRRWETSGDWGGVQQFRHRAYDPGTGTWLQEDPLGVAGGVNVYQYNNGNPVSFSDPMGMVATSNDTTYVGCREVGGSDGTGLLGHCAVRVVNEALGVDVMIELSPTGMKNDFRVVGPESQSTKAYGDRWVAIDIPAGSDEESFDRAVLHRAGTEMKARSGVVYLPGGARNSNNYVSSVITGAGGAIPRRASAGFVLAPGICGGTFGARGSRCN